MRTSLRLRIRWYSMWVRSILMFYPYMWRCPEENCYFMVSTNQLSVLEKIRRGHVHTQNAPHTGHKEV